MNRRSLALLFMLSVLGLSPLVGCDTAPATTMAPKGHDGNAHGKIDTSVDRAPAAKYSGPRR